MPHHCVGPRQGLVVAIALGLAAGAPFAGADEAPAATDAAPAGPAAGTQPAEQLSEVVVTATKRRQSLRDIPATVSSISGEELAQRNAQGVQDIVKLVPGVNYTESGDSPGEVTIRGISSAPGTGFTTGVLFGDVSFTDQYIPISSLDPNPFDLKSVDVLKGPQGTLFGASALNGAIRYVPNPARFGQWQLDYYAQGSRYVEDSGWKPNYGAVVNIPIGERLALRVMGFERDSPGYLNNTRVGGKGSNYTDQSGARAILGWEPVDALDVRLSYAWQNTHLADSNVASTSDGSLINGDKPRLSPQHVNYSLLDLNAAYDFGFARLVSETSQVHKGSHAYYDASSHIEGSLPDPGSIPLLAEVSDGYSNTFSQELRLVSPEDRSAAWQWTTGLFYSRQHVFTSSSLPFGDPSIPIAALLPVIDAIVPGVTADQAVDNVVDVSNGHAYNTITEAALFADVTRRLWKDVELSLGARLYDTNSAGNNEHGGASVLAVTGQPQTFGAAGLNERGINPKMSLAWHITPDVMTYASAAKGFRVGGLQPGQVLPSEAPPPPVFQSDSIWNYETGLRTQWFRRKLRLDLTGFYERWKHPQYMTPDAAGISSYLTNVGGVKSVGGEASVQVVLPLPGLLLTTTGAYANTVTTAPFTRPDGSTAPSGSLWPFAPHWQTATTLAYAFDLGELGVQSQLTHTYLSHAVNDLVQQLPVFGYQQLDAGVGLSDRRLKWLPDFSLTVKNVTDTRAYSNRKIVNEFGQREYEYVTPRAIYLRLSGHF